MKSYYHKIHAHLNHLSQDIPLNQHVPEYQGGGGWGDEPIHSP
jgi:hypothetical protein